MRTQRLSGACALQQRSPVSDLCTFVHLGADLYQLWSLMYRCRMQNEAAAKVHGNTEAPPGEQVGS